MPSKQKRRRGCGGPSRTQEQDAPPKQQRYVEAPQRPPDFEQRPPQQQRPIAGFFVQTPPSEEAAVCYEPSSEHVPAKQEKEKMHTVDPEGLGIELKHKLSFSPTLPVRSEVGNLGRRIKLISNCFSARVPSGNVYHYDVQIIIMRRNSGSEAESAIVLPTEADKKDKKYHCLSAKKNREIIALMSETNQNFSGVYAAYDGQKNLYTRKPLNIQDEETLTCEVIIPDGNFDDPRGPKQNIFKVLIKPVKKKGTKYCAINLDSLHALFEKKTNYVSQETIMALETILRNGPCLRFTPIGHSFFYPPNPDDLHPLGGGREIWFGYHQSLRLGQWKPMVNLDITATTFYQKGPLLHYFAEFLNMTLEGLLSSPKFTDQQIKQVSSKLENIRIKVNHLRNYKRKYHILRLVNDSAQCLKFNFVTENGTTVEKTVCSYFRDHHRRELKFPFLPCVQVKNKTKAIYFPIEVCNVIEGQHCKKKLEERQNTEMIKFTARPSNRRFSEIKDIISRVDFNRDPYVREFGLEVSQEPLSLEGRVLDAPSIRYKDGAPIKPKDGSWKMQETQFFKGAEIKSWVLISFAKRISCSDEQLSKFAEMLVRIGRETGISIKQPACIQIIDNRNWTMKNLFSDMKTKYKADLVIVVIPQRNQTIYGDIKQAAETIVGLTTQCVKDENVARKCNHAVVRNLCQKINTKMGGVNNFLAASETPNILKKPVIIIGADVNHPGPSHDIKPSLASCVGSLDGYPSRYAVTCRAQTNVDEKKQAVEIILDLKNMILELLKAFYHHTGRKKPEKIIFYRDGVSEGQFEMVRDYEVKCIREACKTLGADYEPGITFIVVQKRHHIRFMPQDSRDGVGRMKNIPPGTTVDTTVTHPINFDFFLCSHFGQQGTSRPGHYTVIEDDNDFTANDLQKLTYFLCHTYVRCTKSISIPAPVAYAHLAAYRARQYLEAQLEESTTSNDESSDNYNALPQVTIEAIKVLDGLKSSMYFV